MFHVLTFVPVFLSFYSYVHPAQPVESNSLVDCTDSRRAIKCSRHPVMLTGIVIIHSMGGRSSKNVSPYILSQVPPFYWQRHDMVQNRKTSRGSPHLLLEQAEWSHACIIRCYNGASKYCMICYQYSKHYIWEMLITCDAIFTANTNISANIAVEDQDISYWRAGRHSRHSVIIPCLTALI